MNLTLPPPPPGYEKWMPPQSTATELCIVGCDAFGREVQLAPEAAKAWVTMQNAAATEHVHLLLLSGFRSLERQREIVQKKLAGGSALTDILRVNAYPGYSEHHTGRAIDVGAPNSTHFTEEFEHTVEFSWLSAQAGRFGFALSYPRSNPHRIAYEPWHWCLKVEP